MRRVGSDRRGPFIRLPVAEKFFGFLPRGVVRRQAGLQIFLEQLSRLVEIAVIFDVGSRFRERDARFFRRECPRLRE